ncbi:hypothetical protein ACGC1H_004289 [Rhizoctonia solani]
MFERTPTMSTQPGVELGLPSELLSSIFELVSPEVLVIAMRCSRCFFEICNPLLYREVHLHTPTQLVTLSESQKAMHMLCATGSLVIDDFVLYLEAWDGANAGEFPKPFQYIFHVLRATKALHSLKVSPSYVPSGFHRRVDWESDHAGNLRRTTGDPELLPSLTFISVYSDQANHSWFETFCYDRVIECYSTWNNKNLHLKIFPALEWSDATAPSVHLSLLAASQLATYPKQYLSGRDVGRLIRRSFDSDKRSKITHLGLLLQFPDVTLHGKPSSIHNTFSWLKDMFSMAGCPQLQGFHVKFKSPPLDWAASLDTQRLGLEELQNIMPALVTVGLSSTGQFWKRWVPPAGGNSSYSTIPYWTPCPVMDLDTRTNVRAMLVWWFNALGFDISDMQDRAIMKDFAKRVHAAMYERWELIAPSEDTLHDRLLNYI